MSTSAWLTTESAPRVWICPHDLAQRVMSKEHEIEFGNSKQCALDVEGGTVELAPVPELTLSRYPVRGLIQGELSILVTRTAMPAIVRVEAIERGTNLPPEEVEQIRKLAEGIFRGQVG